MQVGVLGTGEVAKSLARGFLATGHSVTIGTREPGAEKVKVILAELGPKSSAATFAEAAQRGEIVVLAVRGAVAEEVVAAAGPDHLANKVLVDPTNPLVFHPNGAASLFVGHTDSLGERVQRAAPKALVVKAFNTIGNPHFYRPQFPGGPPTMFYCGNDAGAKEVVGGILREFGFRPVDLGGIEASRELESVCILWVRAARAVESWDIAVTLLKK